MPFKRGKGRTGRILLLAVMLIAVGLAGFGCVRGLTPIGWSGGAVSGDTMFVGSSEGRLVAINLLDESRQWTQPLKKTGEASGLFGCAPAYGGGCGGASGVAIYGTPVIDGELVYIGGHNGKIYAYTIDSLAMRWVYPREGYFKPIVGGLAVARDKVYLGDSEGMVIALDAATGDPEWGYETGEKIWSTPAIADGTLFIGSFDKNLYALNADDGKLRWEFPTEGSIITTPLVSNGTVYFGSFDRYFYAVNTADGKEKWRFMGESWFWARPVIHGNTIYAACLDDKVYALRADNGMKMAEFDLGSPVSSSPVIYDNSVIFASREGMIYAIDTGNNSLRELAEIEEEVYGPISINNGIVYIHTQDLTLHRINVVNGAVLRSISLKSQD